MDAKEFLKERNKMCRSYGNCRECAALEINCGSCVDEEDIDVLVDAVEEWSERHKKKTNLDKLKEVFPDCSVGWGPSLTDGFIAFVTSREPGFWEKEYKGDDKE